MSLLPLDGVVGIDDAALLERVTAALHDQSAGHGIDTEEGERIDEEPSLAEPPEGNGDAHLKPYLQPEYRLSDGAYQDWLARLKQDPKTRTD